MLGCGCALCPPPLLWLRGELSDSASVPFSPSQEDPAVLGGQSPAFSRPAPSSPATSAAPLFPDLSFLSPGTHTAPPRGQARPTKGMLTRLCLRVPSQQPAFLGVGRRGLSTRHAAGMHLAEGSTDYFQTPEPLWWFTRTPRDGRGDWAQPPIAGMWAAPCGHGSEPPFPHHALEGRQLRVVGVSGGPRGSAVARPEREESGHTSHPRPRPPMAVLGTLTPERLGSSFLRPGRGAGPPTRARQVFIPGFQ